MIYSIKSNSYLYVSELDTTGFSQYQGVSLDQANLTLSLVIDPVQESDIVGVISLLHSNQNGKLCVQTQGILNWPSHGKTIGQEYYISGDTAGDFVDSPPSQNSKPIFVPLDANWIILGVGDF